VERREWMKYGARGDIGWYKPCLGICIVPSDIKNQCTKCSTNLFSRLSDSYKNLSHEINSNEFGFCKDFSSPV